MITEPARKTDGEGRLLYFGKINTHQPSSSHSRADHESAEGLDRTWESEPLPEYNVPDPYQRPRYNQPPPPLQEFAHRRLDEDYQDDYALEPSSFVQSQEYRQPSSREFRMSRRWPNFSYMYGRTWNPRHGPAPYIPPWYLGPPVDPQFKYWPRERFPPTETTYWSNLRDEEEIEDEIAAKRLWRQRQQERYPWTSSRSSSWPMEKPLKPISWQRQDRPTKTQGREQFSTDWSKSKNRSEPGDAAAKPDLKGKPVVPQITMKTWNSLTSDPATWPYKLPGAKPWPKDENGKSYNPNADLVKKLGLDKQEGDWPKATSKPHDASSGKKMKNETSKDISRKYKPDWEKSELSEYKTKSRLTKPGKSRPRTHYEDKSREEWRKPQEGESPQNDQASSWPRKYESAGNWPGKDSLPKIQSVGAWVMPADQSTWKPYQIKPIQSLDDNSSSRKWTSSSGISRVGPAERKWPAKGASRWTEKMKDGGQWMDESHAVGSWPEKSNGGGTWPAKATKSSSWYSKAKEPNGGWSNQGNTANLWGSNAKENSSWRSKPNDWYSKITDNNSWSVKPNPVSWTKKSNESDVWSAKTNTGKFNNAASWAPKMSREETWPRKAGETSSWPSKMNELGSWPAKVSDAWNYGKSSTGTWPTKWKQFAYHRVTAMPISKPGTTADASASKPKNAFVAVSAVSSPKYGAGSEWRKNEEEVRESAASAGGQTQVSLESPIFAWKKDAATSSAVRGLGADLLENQLEALRQIDFWPYKESEAEKEFTSTTERSTSATAKPGASNSTTQTISKQREAGKESSEPLATDERAIPVK